MSEDSDESREDAMTRASNVLGAFTQVFNEARTGAAEKVSEYEHDLKESDEKIQSLEAKLKKSEATLVQSEEKAHRQLRALARQWRARTVSVESEAAVASRLVRSGWPI